MASETSRGVQAGVAAFTVWGLLTVYWKQLDTFDPFELVAWRIACAAVVMAVVVTATRGWTVLVGALRDRRTCGRLLLAAVMLTANWTSYVLFGFAARRVPFGLLGPLQYIVPTINLVLGWFVYDETMSASRLVGFALVWTALAAITFDRNRTTRDARFLAAGLSPTAGG